MAVRAFAPGRVNLMGDHTDHTGGLVLPMAVDLGTTVVAVTGGDEVVLRSEWAGDEVRLPIDVTDPAAVQPTWGRYVAGVVAELRPAAGLVGTVATTLPVGAGLSSSAALELAVALALGADPEPVPIALACQRAEQRASGVPCGIMDQLASAAGVAGHALRIDCHDLSLRPVPFPEGIGVWVVHSGQERSLAGSSYAERAAACQRAEATVGPLRGATLDALGAIDDAVVRRRARHVVSENGRVDALVDALATHDRTALAEVMAASHASLRDDFEVSTPALDALVDQLVATPGVLGARLTGAGFGGCVVALAEAGTEMPQGRRAWPVRPSAGARLL
ncbi:MAG: galactokinase [Acidimicrobiia bacterium]